MSEVYVLLARCGEWYAPNEYQKSFATAKEVKKYIQSVYGKGEFIYKADNEDYEFKRNPKLECYTRTPIRRKDDNKYYSLMIHKDEI